LLLAGTASAGDDYEVRWSVTSELRYKAEKFEEKAEDLTGFFDQYEFVRNKESSGPFELALSEVNWDLFVEEETPMLRFRLRSPASDLSLSGGGFDTAQSFLNQRGELYGRLKGLALDLDYRRARTEELRLFTDPTDPTGALGFNAIAATFNDDTKADDRFSHRRTRIGSELRIRPQELLFGDGKTLGKLLSEIALRGGYGERNGKRQARSMLDFTDIGVGGGPTDLWRGLTVEQDQEVRTAGAGLVFAPGGLFTLAVDFDHQRFREDAPTILQTDLHALDPAIGITPIVGPLPNRSQRTFAFVPDTDRTTGTARLNSRLGDRATIHGALQISSLKQEGNRTPFEKFAGLRGNKVLFYSGNLAASVKFTQAISGNAFFKFDHRRNEIPRDTVLFNASNGTQIDPFLRRVRRVTTGAELVYRFPGLNRIALGTRGEWKDRDLDFATPTNPFADAILRRNAVIDERTRTFDFYLRTTLRPCSGTQLSGKIGFRNSPDTGYTVELDNVTYGEARVSYTLPIGPPATLSFFARGESGENHDFTQVSTDGTTRDQDFDRDRYSYGATLSHSPRDGVTMFGSLFWNQDAQDFDLIRSTLRRFRAPFAPVLFFVDSPLDYRADLASLVVGGRAQLTASTDASLSYWFTRSNTRFQPDRTTATTLDGASRIRSDVHSLELEIGHLLRQGLRISAGYRFDNYRDRISTRGSAGVVAPFNRSTRQHTVILGVTLNSDLLQ
jgi:hypothetical protein